MLSKLDTLGPKFAHSIDEHELRSLDDAPLSSSSDTAKLLHFEKVRRAARQVAQSTARNLPIVLGYKLSQHARLPRLL